MNRLLAVLVISAAMIGSGVYLAYRSDSAPADPQKMAAESAARPSPIADKLPQPPLKVVSATKEMSRARAAEAAADDAKPKAELGGSDWAVVAAIYKEFEAAERRARSIASGSAFRATVHPARGQGSKYMVVLASGMTQGKAMEIRERAINGGLPGDTYVTRLRGSSD